MKKSLAVIFILTTFLVYIKAEVETGTKENADYQLHKGFFLNLGLGVNFTGISLESNQASDMFLNGTGSIFNLKIGGALKENLLLHATLTGRSYSGGEIEIDGITNDGSNNMTISENLTAIGLTYYVMPSNVYLSGSIGLGRLSINNADTDYQSTTDRGFGMQLEIGKEWWVSKRWGLGAAITYGKTVLTNTPGNSLEEKIDTNNFGILFSASLN